MRQPTSIMMVILLKFDYWTGVLGPVMGLLMAAGTVAALMVLFRRVAVGRQVVGEVVGIRRHESLNVIEVDIQCKGRWAGHDSGQFAFVTLHAEEGPHPYTISSAWTGDGRITFIIKALADIGPGPAPSNDTVDSGARGGRPAAICTGAGADAGARLMGGGAG